MVQGSKCAVLNSLYEKGTLPRELGAFKKLLIQIYRIRPSAEAAYKEFEKAYRKRDMSVRHYLLHLEELQRKVNLDDGYPKMPVPKQGLGVELGSAPTGRNCPHGTPSPCLGV
eukprot:scaffold2378_cov363-Pavlova_lutheri.AAC.1